MGYFSTYLALSGPAWVGLTTLGYRYRRIYAEAAFSILHPNRRDELGQPFIAELDDIKVQVQFLDSPLPQEAYQRALEMNYAWPEAEAVLSAQTGHVIVSLVDEPQDHSSALNGAAAVTLVAGALSDLLPTVAVVSSEGAVVMPPDTFVPLAQELSREQIPIPFWTSLAFFRGEPDADGVRLQGAYSVGLSPFIGRELEFAPSNMEPIEIAERMVGLFQMLILNGPILQDGETVGASEDERINIHFKSSGVVEGVPVIELSIRPQPDNIVAVEETPSIEPDQDFAAWNEEGHSEPVPVVEAAPVDQNAFSYVPKRSNWWAATLPAVDPEIVAEAGDVAPPLDPVEIVAWADPVEGAAGFNAPLPVHSVDDLEPMRERFLPPQPIGLLHEEPKGEPDPELEHAEAEITNDERPRPKPMGQARVAPSASGRAFGKRNLS